MNAFELHLVFPRRICQPRMIPVKEAWSNQVAISNFIMCGAGGWRLEQKDRLLRLGDRRDLNIVLTLSPEPRTFSGRSVSSYLVKRRIHVEFRIGWEATEVTVLSLGTGTVSARGQPTTWGDGGRDKLGETRWRCRTRTEVDMQG